MIQIAPSILSCDFARLGEEVKAVEAAGVDIIHVDVMDGHFVPNISIGVPIVKSLRPVTKLPLDCHLMISEPGKYIDAFAEAGADWISVHAETCDLATVLPQIRAAGCKAGAVINPPTNADTIIPHLELCDYVLVMSVNPGFSGQKFIPGVLDKVRALKSTIAERGLNIPIQIDGGMNIENTSTAVEAGVDISVYGNAMYKSDNYSETVLALKAS